MNRIVKVFFFVFFFTLIHVNAKELVLSPEENLWLKNTEKLRVRVAKDLLPVQDVVDGKFIGIGVEYIKAFGKKFGLEVEFIPKYTWSEALKRIKNREGIDILLQGNKTKNRAKSMLFTTAYLNFPYVIAQKTGNNYNSLSSLKNKKIAMVKKHVVNDFLHDGFKACKCNQYDDILQALISVSTSKSDAYIGSLALVAKLIEKHGLVNLQISNIIPIPPVTHSMITAKDWGAFVTLFDKFYNSLDETTHTKIRRKYTPIFADNTPMKKSEYEIILNEKEALYILNNPNIVVSNELDWYPYDFNTHGVPQGYVIDLVQLLAKKIGLSVEFKTAAWPELHKAFKKKQLDILYPARKTKQRETYALFGNPFMKTKNVFITRKERNDISDLRDLKDKRLALGRGWTITKVIKKLYPNAKILEFDTSIEMYEAVAFDLADVTIDDYMTASYIINKEMLANLKIGTKVNEENILDSSLYMMFQKDNSILQRLFDKAMLSVKPQEIYELKEKWIHSVEKQTNEAEHLVFSNKEKKYLLQKKKINMCIDPDWMPLEANREGEHIGISADYMRLLEKSIGIPIEMIPTETWLESIEFAKQRRCDIYSLAMPTPERKLYMDFTKPYINIPLVLVTAPTEIFYADVSSIQDKKIGIVEGYAYGEILKTRYPNMKLVHVKNITDGMEKVENKKLFGFIGTLATVGYKIKEEYFGTLKIAGKFDENRELGVGTRNDEPLLKSIFNKAIDTIPAQQHHAILNKWVTVEYNQRINYTLMLQIFLGICFLGSLLLYRQYKLKEYNKKLQTLSVTDPLTGLYNRLKLDEVLEYEKKFYERYGRDLSIILIDIDDFKQINDIYGHHVGDDVLKAIAKTLQENKRYSDTLGRWGGEEFLIICPETDGKGACMLAQKCRTAIESSIFEGINISQSASFGVAQFQKQESIKEVFKRADMSLYQAKAAGKNCVRSS